MVDRHSVVLLVMAAASVAGCFCVVVSCTCDEEQRFDLFLGFGWLVRCVGIMTPFLGL